MSASMSRAVDVEGRRILVRGTVQGVGFRPWVYRLAVEEGLSGRVRNDARGVTIEAFGRPEALEAFLRRLGKEAPPAALVREVREEPIPAEPLAGFAIVPSEGEGARRVSIPPDLATCAECLREVQDPADRRHLYPFTNCTHCGPRYTIARDVPYDRPATTMAGFAMCPACRREYEDPLDRRFHAQPIACPACGPRVRLLDAVGRAGGGRRRRRDRGGRARPSRDGADRGGEGPRRLPPRLRRDVVRGRAAACASARSATRSRSRSWSATSTTRAGPGASSIPPRRRLLASVERPIVLVRQRPGGGLAPEVAPGNPLVGLILAYTPLHHLLLEAAGRPLVMTSGNLSEEPMAAEDAEALERLSGIADLFLAHDREIENRCDDSVARVIAGRPTVFRRSRGYVPRAVPLRRPVRRPVLACGAHLKNTFCLAAGDEAWLGPHIGDLDNLEATRAFEEQVERLQRFLGIRPEVIAHDLHPDYASTRYALARPEAVEGRRCSTTTPTWRARWASTVSTARSSAWPGTGRATGRTGRPGAASCCSCARAPSSGWRRCARCGSPAATRRSGRSGAIALAALDDAYGGAPPLERLRLFDVGARPRRRRRPADGRAGGSTRRSPTAPAGTSTRSAPWGWRGGGRATRGRWRWSGTSPPTRPRRDPIPST